MVWIAFDDTDSVAGGCTTHTALGLLRRCPSLDLIGPPRLVRLNPNIPHKTRGNGAVALRLGHGTGAPRPIGHTPQGRIDAYSTGTEPSEDERDRLYATAQRLIQETARLDDPKTHPGLVMTDRLLEPGLYWSAVRRYVGLSEAVGTLSDASVRYSGWKTGRGVLGAAAALAWPAERGTFEWIGYRAADKWGTPRDLDPALGRRLDADHPSTFDNYDARHGHLRIAPASPCPVLAGIRGTDPGELLRAGERIGPERAESALLFATNQATDDHLQPMTGDAVRPFTSPTLTLHVVHGPVTWAGGHVFVRAADESGPVDLAAFEPTKDFRAALRSLRPGDRVRAHGGVHGDPTLVSLEKFELLEAIPRRRARAPDCPQCGRRMKSRGRDDGYRCRGCRTRAEAPHWEPDVAGSQGAFEVPTLVRRHLARPLRLKNLATLPAAG